MQDAGRCISKRHMYLKKWRHITEADTRIATETIEINVPNSASTSPSHSSGLVEGFNRFFQYSC